MTQYLLKRLLHGALSIVVVVALVMTMVYSWLDRTLIFAQDSNYTHQNNNNKTVYTYSRWEAYGYLDYVTFADYLNDQVAAGALSDQARAEITLGRTEADDTADTAQWIKSFTDFYEGQNYSITRLPAVVLSNGRVADGGQPQLFAYRDLPILTRLVEYFLNLVQVDNIHYVPEDADIGERGLTFTWHDPAYGGEKFAPAIIGNGTRHKYLLYFDNCFPYIHQNLLTLNLGMSYTVNSGVDVFTTMTRSQGGYLISPITYPTGHAEESADNLHTATYAAGSLELSPIAKTRFVDDYTAVDVTRAGYSKLGYSFVIGIISVVLAYLLGLPIGLAMALRKDGLIDKLGTLYIVFIIAVPSLAYIFLFKAIGGRAFGLPTTFDMQSPSRLMYILPIISLALPSVANLMKWMRRYMIDQMNSDYVKFARSGGLTESEIFTKHIWKNAMIPIVHGIPGSVLFAMTGAIITERVYVVPGAGNLLTEAINKYDNGVIVGVTLFYAVLSVVAIILGDVLMATVDPRISFTTKDR